MADARLVKDVYSQFPKEEILSLAAELGVEASPKEQAKVIAARLIDDINANGLPVTDDCSATMLEFLSVSEFIKEGEETETGEDGEDETEEVENPQCYTLADVHDPSCKKCILLEPCKAARIAARPPCFGLSYDKTAPECQSCIEAPFCRAQMES